MSLKSGQKELTKSVFSFDPTQEFRPSSVLESSPIDDSSQTGAKVPKVFRPQKLKLAGDCEKRDKLIDKGFSLNAPIFIPVSNSDSGEKFETESESKSTPTPSVKETDTLKKTPQKAKESSSDQSKEWVKGSLRISSDKKNMPVKSWRNMSKLAINPSDSEPKKKAKGEEDENIKNLIKSGKVR